jgi:hypothetical protein
MTLHAEVKDLSLSKAEPTNFFSRLLRFLAKLLSSPKGDQGGWE